MAFDFATTCWQVHYVITLALSCSPALFCTIKILFYSILYLVCLAFLPLTFLLYITSDRKLGGGPETRLALMPLTNGFSECGSVCF